MMFSAPMTLDVEPVQEEVHKIKKKRSRVARACDACRAKRVKCDGRRPACIPCTNYEISCSYVESPNPRAKLSKPRIHGSVKGRLAQIEEFSNARATSPIYDISVRHREQELPKQALLERIELWSEASLDHPTIPSIDEEPPVHGCCQLLVEPQNRNKSESTASYLQPAASGKWRGSLVINGQGDLQYLGPSSSLAVLSQAADILGNGNAIHQQLHMSEFPTCPNEVTDAGSSPPVPRAIANKYIEAYFTHSPFPLFNQSKFVKRANLMYTDHPPTEKCVRASWNMVLAFGSHYVEVPKVVPLEETEGWKYFNAAHDRLSDLLQGSNLSALQALLLIVQYLQFTGRASRWMLMGSCAQMALALGLHRNSHLLTMDPSVREERTKVFWVCYIMDKTIAMGVGRSPALQDYDCDAALPLDSSDSCSRNSPTNSDWRHHMFLHNIHLSKIISKVYRRLYSTQAVANHTIDSLADAVSDLDMALMAWRDNIPANYRPECEVSWKPTVFCRHILQLHFGYYSCLYNIHRAVSTMPFETMSSSPISPDRPLHILRRNRIYGSSAIAIGAARASLRLALMLVEQLPGLIDMRIWLAIYFPFSAVIALFIAIVRNPRQASAKTDVALITSATEVLEKIHVPSEVLDKMKSLTNQFQTEASAIVERLSPKKQIEDLTDRLAKKTPVDSRAQPETLRYPSHGGTMNCFENYGPGQQTDAQQLFSDWNKSDHTATSNATVGECPESPVLLEVHGKLSDEMQTSISQDAEPSDLWQVPLSFEWDQWAAYVEKFPGDLMELNEVVFTNRS